MASTQANGIEIEYELAGTDDAPVLMMIHGVGAQLIRWPDELCDQFMHAGFRTLRFDNRDIGLSSHMDGAPIPDMAEVLSARAAGHEPELPYTISDMAADAAGLLDALGIAKAHILGVSLGGMIAQMLAITHPARVLSLNIIMSASGNAAMPPSTPDAIGMLSRRPPNPNDDREAFLAHQVALNRVLGSPAYPAPEAELRQFAARAADRAWNPAGAARQLAASRGASDRREQLRSLSVPTLVIHGVDDPLLPIENAADIARNIPGAWLLEVNGMGHDLPAELFDLIVGAVTLNRARANDTE